MDFEELLTEMADGEATGSGAPHGEALTSNSIRGGIIEPAPRGDERTTLLAFLQRQRELLAWKLRDAPDAALRTASTASGLTLHGLVRHVTEVERSWLRDVFAGQGGLSFHWSDEDPDGEWHVPADVTMADLLADYAAEAELCDAVVAAASLDDVAQQRDFSLRWILLHLIEELARHLGHVDVLREHVDGSVGEEPDIDEPEARDVPMM